MQTVLIIDDNAELREKLREFLQYEGLGVLEAADGQAGVRTAQAEQPDVIICDVMMPVLDGFAASQRLKSDPATAHIPIIMLSAATQVEQITRGLANAEEYVLKPFNLVALKARLVSMLRLKGVQDELRELNRNLEERVASETAAVRMLSDRILHVREEERAAIAAELHDDVGQNLFALNWMFEKLGKDLQSAQPACVVQFEEISRVLGDTMARIRSLSHTLSPISLQAIGLRGALDKLIEHYTSRFEVTLDLEELEGFFPDDWNIGLYRIVQECVLNAAKHSGATQLAIRAGRLSERLLSLRVADNGKGMQAEPRVGPTGGLGLHILRQRVAGLGGEMQVRSDENGTEFIFEIPRE